MAAEQKNRKSLSLHLQLSSMRSDGVLSSLLRCGIVSRILLCVWEELQHRLA